MQTATGQEPVARSLAFQISDRPRWSSGVPSNHDDHPRAYAWCATSSALPRKSEGVLPLRPRLLAMDYFRSCATVCLSTAASASSEPTVGLEVAPSKRRMCCTDRPLSLPGALVRVPAPAVRSEGYSRAFRLGLPRSVDGLKTFEQARKSAFSSSPLLTVQPCDVPPGGAPIFNCHRPSYPRVVSAHRLPADDGHSSQLRSHTAFGLSITSDRLDVLCRLTQVLMSAIN